MKKCRNSIALLSVTPDTQMKLVLTSSGHIHNWISKYVFEAFLILKNPTDFTLHPLLLHAKESGEQ